MPSTVVLQSHRDPLPHTWLEPCLRSVRAWAKANRFDYRFMHDELFDLVPLDQVRRVRAQTVIASDLARLLQLRQLLQQGYDTVIWCDADFLVYDPHGFHLTNDTYALGREVWIQRDRHKRLRAYRKVHNAFLMFRHGNSLLDFYIETALKLLRRAGDDIPPQFIGPKMLTALHNIALCPVQESAGMLSPLVIQDIIDRGGEALQLFYQRSAVRPCAANLCASSVHTGQLSDRNMQQVITRLVNGVQD